MLPGFDYLLNKRRLTKESIKAFHLGYCDSNGYIYVDTDFPDQSLKLDYKFKNSVLFPICDAYNKLIGVSARKLDYETNKDLKYVNTVYPKTDHLYGLNITWPYCLKERTAYVVEGNMDAIIMYQYGIKNVVGMLGSALKLNQVCLLSRFVDRIIIIPDGDDGGGYLINRLTGKEVALISGEKRKINEKRALIQKYHNLDLDFSYLQLPKGYDPDKYLFEFGKDSLMKLPIISLNESIQEGVLHE
jgi:DNA primase